jgi:large subunit ribosomal protein L33
MAKAGARDKITLACTDCKQRNYNTMKNKKNDRTVWK